MRCEHCLTAGTEEARFCSTCGRLLATTADVAGPPPATEPVDHHAVAFDETISIERRQCESCGAPAFGGRKLCEACDTTFGSVLRRESGTHEVALPPREPEPPRGDEATLIFAASAISPAPEAEAPREEPALGGVTFADDADAQETIPVGTFSFDGERSDSEAVTLLTPAFAVPAASDITAVPAAFAPLPSLSTEETTCLTPALPEESSSFVADEGYVPRVPVVARAPWEAPDAAPVGDGVASQFAQADGAFGSPAAREPEPAPWWERPNQPSSATPPVPRPTTARFTASGSYRLPPPQFERIPTPTPAPSPRPAAGPTVQPRPAPSRRLGLGVSVAAVTLVLVGAPLVWWSPWSGSADQSNEVAVPDEIQAQAAPVPAPVKVKRSTGAAKPGAEARKPAAVKTPPARPRRPATGAKPPARVQVPYEPLAVAAAPPAGMVATLDAPAPPPPPPPAPLDPLPSGPVFEVAQVDVRPQITNRVEPRRPDHLSGRRVEDVVILRVLVAPSGRLSDVRVLRGSKIDGALDAAAVSAVRRWSFSPARRKGQAVSCWYNVGLPLRFDGN